MPSSTSIALDELIATAHALGARGWLPATSGNLSCRLDSRRLALTASGGDKGALTHDGVLEVLIDGLPHPRSSAEAPLHYMLYRSRPAVGAVLHGHSLASTVASRLFAAKGALVLRDYELLKALRGIRTHDVAFEVPILPNDQDVPALAALAAERLATLPDACAFLIAGHGLYAWGADLNEAFRHFEAIEFLLSCELESSRISR